MESIYTPEEYLERERAAVGKSEFWNGKIIERDASSETHMTININLICAVGNRLHGAECRGMGNDLKVRTPSKRLFAYPDLTIVCGKRLYHDAETDTLLNPTVLFEILSPSTEAVDRGEKFLNYRQLESLRDYVLVSQDAPRIEHYARNENNEWIPSITLGLDAEITLAGLALTLPLSEIYEDIIFPPLLTVEAGGE